MCHGDDLVLYSACPSSDGGMVLHVRRAWLGLPFDVMILAPSSRPAFPGSSVVKTLCYKCRECRFDP